MAANLIPTPSPPPPHSLLHHRTHHYTAWSHTPSPLIKPFKSKLTPLCSTPSSSSSSVVEEKTTSQPETSNEDANKLPFRGCKACGREEIAKGCNGEGRIQGGIATVPGFGWWPIKAFRPCPGLVESGGRYRRRGQSMDEVAWGRSEMEATTMSIDELNSR
ncbi:hypothetical protein ACHQM5_011913 [Ranunculus cassubicifolius]